MYYNNKITIITSPKYNININKVHIDKSDNDDDNDDVNKWMICCFMLVLVSKSIGYSIGYS